MTIQELIDKLITIEDKTKIIEVPDVSYSINGNFIVLDSIDNYDEHTVKLY